MFPCDYACSDVYTAEVCTVLFIKECYHVHISSCWCICLVCSIFLHFPTFHVISPFRKFFPFSFSLGYFALRVLWLTDVSIIVIKGTVFSKNQKVNCSNILFPVNNVENLGSWVLKIIPNVSENTIFCKYAIIILNWNRESFCKNKVIMTTH